ncbi:outer membrane protein [Allorhizobium terrae]|uniref:Porin family protein n=1 Tax=Allorhizobium terrae TaxID=1848972 RepID=A0A4S4A5R9_9HYPH|nr:outer membrane protein [Allorhizobium terrae]THF53855.1 porin family protein [Allorhizobium terrae]TWD54561.1 outer membrane immunogenic protein [Agrobacterium vitis]
MKKIILAAGVASLFMSGAAFAADAVETIPAPPAAVDTPAPVFSWAGGYAGVHGGYGWADGRVSGPSGSSKQDFDGGRMGGFAGWNFDMGNNVILGAEGDLNYDWNKSSFGSQNFGTELSGSVRARAGYAMDKALLYVAGGWTGAGAKFKDSATGVNTGEMVNGWTVGAGVDYAVTDKIFTRAEYRYNDYGSKNFFGGNNVRDLSQNVINVGVGMKF